MTMSTQQRDPAPGDPSERLDDAAVQQVCASIDAFVAAVRSRGLPRVVLAYRDEYGPYQDRSGQATYGTVRELTLLAYDRGLLISCTAHDAIRSTVLSTLQEHGLAVEERSRNLTTSAPPQDARRGAKP